MIAAIWTAIGILAAGLFSSIYFSVQRMDAGFARLEARMDARFGQVDSRFNSLTAHMDARFDAVTARLDAHIDRHAG